MQPRREARELEWLLAEIALTDQAPPPGAGIRELDIAVVVTGATADRRALAVPLADAPSRFIAVVDPVAQVATAHEYGALVLRGHTSTELAAAWDAGAHA
mgnify:CR=1 FL=1